MELGIEFKWTPELSVGDDTIDAQHQTLLDNVNKLSIAMINFDGSETVKEIIDFLENYAKEHFSHEEEYMREHEYPAYKEHKAMHNTFIKKYKEFKARITGAEPTPALISEVQTYTGRWLLHHIGVEDQKYEEYILNNR